MVVKPVVAAARGGRRRGRRRPRQPPSSTPHASPALPAATSSTASTSSNPPPRRSTRSTSSASTLGFRDQPHMCHMSAPYMGIYNRRGEGSNKEEAISQLREELLREGVTCGITCIDLSPIAVPRMRDRLAEQGTSDKFTDMVDSLFPSSIHAMLRIVTRLLIHQAPYCGYIVCSSHLPSWEEPCTDVLGILEPALDLSMFGHSELFSVSFGCMVLEEEETDFVC